MGGHYIVKINNRCNSNCCFCADSLDTRSKKDHDYKELVQELEENRKKFDSIIISGGEPTIYNSLFRYLKHAKNVCRYNQICLTTNGFLLFYGNFVERLISHGVDSFILSFQSSDKNSYRCITRVKDSFKYVKKAIRNIKAFNKEIRINTVLHKFNYEETDKIVSYLINKKVDSIQLSFMNPVGSSFRGGKSVIAISFSDMMPYVRSAMIKAKELNYDNIFIENFPACIARDLIDKISDFHKPKENEDYYNACKIKLGKCKRCKYDSSCAGVWRAYIEQFGDKEIQPIIENDKY